MYLGWTAYWEVRVENCVKLSSFKEVVFNKLGITTEEHSIMVKKLAKDKNIPEMKKFGQMYKDAALVLCKTKEWFNN